MVSGNLERSSQPGRVPLGSPSTGAAAMQVDSTIGGSSDHIAVADQAMSAAERVRKAGSSVMVTAGRKAPIGPERLDQGRQLLADFCAALCAAGLPAGTDESRANCSEFCGWVQTVYFDGITTDEHGPQCRQSSRSLNRAVEKLCDSQAFREWGSLLEGCTSCAIGEAVGATDATAPAANTTHDDVCGSVAPQPADEEDSHAEDFDEVGLDEVGSSPAQTAAAAPCAGPDCANDSWEFLDDELLASEDTPDIEPAGDVELEQLKDAKEGAYEHDEDHDSIDEDGEQDSMNVVGEAVDGDQTDLESCRLTADIEVVQQCFPELSSKDAAQLLRAHGLCARDAINTYYQFKRQSHQQQRLRQQQQQYEQQQRLYDDALRRRYEEEHAAARQQQYELEMARQRQWQRQRQQQQQQQWARRQAQARAQAWGNPFAGYQRAGAHPLFAWS